MSNERVYLNKPLQQDNVYVTSKLVSLSDITKMTTRKGLEQAVISDGQIVNIVSGSYGHLPNERFFAEVERKLIDAGIEYVTRSINRNNCSFAVDYILSDKKYHVKVKSGNDKLTPMLRFVNSYDGSCKTSGSFGFFREVCSNGLHVSQQQIGFSVKHRGAICEIVLPEIGSLVNKFMDNEFYTLQRKFEVLAETPVLNVQEFVKLTAEKIKMFKFEASDKNPAPSLNANTVIDTMTREARQLGVTPNLWLGYNAFNELLHGKLKKTFEAQKKMDGILFDAVLEMVS